MPFKKSTAKLACLYVLAALLNGCSNGLPPGDNFFPKSGNPILLNHYRGTWKLYIDGKDTTDSTGLKVRLQEDIALSMIWIEQTKTQNHLLPKQFSLQWSTSSISCVECDPKLFDWTRKLGK
ncbi:hypothetical protein [Rhodoferax mekongensis]|uniref:Lipocalin-like domain-containing protein n=1 Tax=Rhodoferax mekongensis TaxID=3068341 RepID=A0ABZ0AXT1_9BURK|nr:hypothetical protein [Rhodoferax sp. TBRC 17307]WNO03948.1 hypothetical protein RAN89_13640 [Rhodoferax sp. TBRC 17307]